MTIKIKGNASGGAILNESDTEVLTVDSTGKLTVPSGVVRLGPDKRIIFSAFKSTSTTLLLNIQTKVLFDSVILNPNSGYEPINSRFTPNVAGWYDVKAAIQLQGSFPSENTQLSVFKNNVMYKRLVVLNTDTAIFASPQMTGSALVYLNGTTDYVEIYAFRTQPSGGTSNILGSADGTSSWFSAHLVYPD